MANLHPELHWSPARSTAIAEDHFAARDWPVGLNNVMPWFRPTVAVALRDRVGELDATAAFEVYTQSAAARTIALATGDTVRTRHGLVLLTTSYSHAPGLSRVVVPGTTTPTVIEPKLRAWAEDHRLTVETLDGGFSAALQNLAEHTDPATTSATAKMIGYPTEGLVLDNGHRSWRGPSAGPGRPRTRGPRGAHPRVADPAPTTPPPGERRH